MIGTIDIEVYKEGEAQAKFLVHGYDDVYWTDDMTSAIMTFTQELRKMSEEPNKEGFCANCGERCDYC